jgi:hypothetical protein
MTLDIWRKFVDSNFKFEFFTNELYEHLVGHCGFVTHSDREGFYNFYFGLNNIDNTFKFVKQFTTGRSAEFGLTYWAEKNNMNGQMVTVMIESHTQVEYYLNSLRSLLLKNSLDEILKRIEPLVRDSYILLDGRVLMSKGYEDHVLVSRTIIRKMIIKYSRGVTHVWEDKAVEDWITRNGIFNEDDEQ